MIFKVNKERHPFWPDPADVVVIKTDRLLFAKYLGDETFFSERIINKEEVQWWTKIPYEWIEDD